VATNKLFDAISLFAKPSMILPKFFMILGESFGDLG
jgi:hypothetical protein